MRPTNTHNNIDKTSDNKINCITNFEETTKQNTNTVEPITKSFEQDTNKTNQNAAKLNYITFFECEFCKERFQIKKTSYVIMRVFILDV